MIPGEVIPAQGEIVLNEDAQAVTLNVANTGDRPVQVGSHYHFAETNPALEFDRDAARGMRLDIAAGTAVRFEPGQRRDVRLVPYQGARRVFGFNGRVMGALMVVLALSVNPGEAQQQSACRDTSQAVMNACAWDDYRQADAMLNDEWKRAMTYARSIGEADALRKAQRLWIPYRDAACDAQSAPYKGGSIQPGVHAMCLARLTDERRRELIFYQPG